MRRLAVLVLLVIGVACTVTIGVDEEAAEERERLRRLVGVDVSTCGGSSYDRPAQRTITNHSDVRINVLVEVDFEDRGGLIVDQSNDRITNLPPGRSAQWEARNFEPSASTCKARVASARPSP